MGLDTSHGCWHGAYGAFTRWRNKLAEVAGYHIAPIKYRDGFEMDTILVDWGHLQDRLHGDWPETPADPLLVLIAHSDCDGVIHPEQAGPLANRLEELLPKLPNEDAPGHIGSWREKTLKFIDGLRAAASAGEDVDFH